MKVCPRSDDGMHHWIPAGYMAMCVYCYKEVTLTGVTNKWVRA